MDTNICDCGDCECCQTREQIRQHNKKMQSVQDQLDSKDIMDSIRADVNKREESDEEFQKIVNEFCGRLYYTRLCSPKKLIEAVIKKGIEIGKKEGIQMEMERIREQVKKDAQKMYNKKGNITRKYLIDMNDIDIWDDVE